MQPNIDEAAILVNTTCDPNNFNSEMGRFIDCSLNLFKPAQPYATITMGEPEYSDPVPTTEPGETLVPQGDDRDLVPEYPPIEIDEPSPINPVPETPQDIPGAGINP